jgi:hypothetical protein
MRAFVYSLGRFEELDTLIMPVMVQHAESFPLAVKALEDPATRGRKEIIGLLGKLALRFVWEIMDDEVAVPDEGVLDHAIVVVAGEWSVANEETRAAIVDTLFRMDGDRAVQFLDNVRNDPDPWLRIHVVELLASIEDRRVPGFIETFLSDEDDMVREMAANVLVAKGYLPSEEASDRCHQVREGEE